MSSSTVRTARRRTLRIAAAALTAAAGLTLTACSGSDTGGSKAAAHLDTEAAAADTSSGAGASADGQESGGQAGTGAKAESGAKAKAEGKTGAPGAAGEKSARSGAGGGSKAGGSGGQRCHTSDLKAAFATGEDAVPDPNASGGTTTSVDLRPDAGGPSWSLARSSAKHGSITLGPGDSTDFTLNLGMAKENDEGSWKPATVAVTPPNETTALTLKWPWGPLVHQDGATHPATFVNPIG
ncbi:flagellar motor protein MotB [Streptomyces sp. NRRL WC-3701]|uniref:DUF4232 domain-containing protein n=1 Tax=Streptomyces sp. NRRL WC-3701 TaxID=1519473 RepID=UPI0006B06C1A|nr:DUF4232 domain-containing protein [Streptomyces sp. NRRL WC-3701]KOT26639.1 flagellar motor protein MotB [Streptomyces sp. NRRL WC-3701]